MALVQFIDGNGKLVPVTASRPLPTSAAGGGMSPDDFEATAPLSWDAETQTLTIDLSGYATATQGDTADSAVQPDDLEPYAKTADLALADANVAANVATGSTVDDVIAALVAAGLMASA